MDLLHYLIGAAIYTVICKVDGQTGTLSIAADRACVGGNLTLTCFQNGTFPTGAALNVIFYRNQDETLPRCSVDTSTACSPSFSAGCGCVFGSGDFKVHKYIISPATKNEEILWRCYRGAFPPNDTVRSADITPDIAQGATLSNGNLSLVWTGSSLVCSGPTSMGDTTLVITNNNTGAVIGNMSSTTLTVPLPTISGTENVTFICSLGGRGERCSNATPGILVVEASPDTTTTASETITPTSVYISTSALSPTGIPDTSTDSTINTTISTELSTSVGTPFSTTVDTTVGTAETTFASSSISPSSIRESTVTGAPGGESSSMQTSSGEQSTWQSIPTTKPPTVSDNGNSNYSVTGAVVGGCIGGIVILIGVAAIIIYRRNSCNCRGKDTSPDSRKPIKHMNTRL